MTSPEIALASPPSIPYKFVIFCVCLDVKKVGKHGSEDKFYVLWIKLGMKERLDGNLILIRFKDYKIP